MADKKSIGSRNLSKTTQETCGRVVCKRLPLSGDEREGERAGCHSRGSISGHGACT